eukprot:CAMPEP_0169339348 /NCGR_PEP_ID=MMETSP1017-20121227/18394_1 /TAXON_ID=342587 /ORGANISM="Karlodinium micrum, Strain CCMP2283" /LENGTH=206 /DNA_ID=CAMNT_0009434929 /DNA_START=78 /DNA_END=696 /DNA_ORIENTATION=-
MPTGKMLRWHSDKGFGFIQPDDGGEDIFCHVSCLLDGDGSVMEGDMVRFKVTYDERRGKDRANEVEVAGGGGGGGGRSRGDRGGDRGSGKGGGGVAALALEAMTEVTEEVTVVIEALTAAIEVVIAAIVDMIGEIAVTEVIGAAIVDMTGVTVVIAAATVVMIGMTVEVVDTTAVDEDHAECGQPQMRKWFSKTAHCNCELGLALD